MAIFQGIGSKPLHKSAGTLTYRYVNGRVIVSQKRTGSIKSKSAARGFGGAVGTYNARIALFKCIMIFSRAHLSAIKAAFNPSKSGNSVNTFMRINYAALRDAWADQINMFFLGQEPTLAQLETALTSYVALEGHKAIYRAKRNGFEDVLLTAAWADLLRLTPLDKSQKVVAVSTANAANKFTISTDLPAIVYGSNMSYLQLQRDADGTIVDFKCDPCEMRTISWTDLLAMDVLTEPEKEAGTITFQGIASGYNGDVLFGTGTSNTGSGSGTGTDTGTGTGSDSGSGSGTGTGTGSDSGSGSGSGSGTPPDDGNI